MLEGALQIDPVSQAWNGKDQALLKLGRLPEAVETLKPPCACRPISPMPGPISDRRVGKAAISGAPSRRRKRGRALAPEAADLRLFLAQTYLVSRIAGKTRKHANWLLAKRPTLAPTHGMLTLASVLDGDLPGGRQHHERLRTLSPEMAGADPAAGDRRLALAA